MNELKNAINEITYRSKIFPQRAFEIITADREGAIPYLRDAVEKALAEQMELDEDYQLHFYALFLLAELRDRDFFPKIMEFVSLPEDVLDFLIGDAVTSGLKEIIYYTYNGDIELLKRCIRNEKVDAYARAELLDVMGQLYQDGDLGENEWKAFIKERVYSGEEACFVYDALASVICRCHFEEMLPDIRYMLDQGLMDESVMGSYDGCVDEMFAYREYDKDFCNLDWRGTGSLKSWAMFEDNSRSVPKQPADLEKLMKQVAQKEKQAMRRKIGRNDPCPCGSGKKYKHCCLNKPASPLDRIESEQERNKVLKDYPYMGSERQENRIYLEDYFDRESIEIDRLLYLGLMHRIGFIWLRDEKAEEKRRREYLKLAFQLFADKVKKENIRTFEDYDRRFSIHYFCRDWMEQLLDLLEKDGDMTAFAEAKTCMEKMNTIVSEKERIDEE